MVKANTKMVIKEPSKATRARNLHQTSIKTWAFHNWSSQVPKVLDDTLSITDDEEPIQEQELAVAIRVSPPIKQKETKFVRSKRINRTEAKKMIATTDKYHCAFLELNDLDGEYDHDLCGARVWNYGFGGQCRKPVQKTNPELEARLVGWDDTKGGLCSCHYGIFSKQGRIQHGLFTEMPPENHTWRWDVPNTADLNMEVFNILLEEKSSEYKATGWLHGIERRIVDELGRKNLDEFGNWIFHD